MASPRQRVVALTIALVFLGTVVISGIAVIWQIVQDQQSPEENVADILDDTNKLKGTKLADFEPVASVKELKSTDLKEGDGEAVKPGATVTAHYTGALAKDGTVFESSYDSGQPAQFSLDGVIAGWTEGVPGMKVGGKRRLVIPADKAYGANSPSPDIPANADLVFDIELVSVQNQ